MVGAFRPRIADDVRQRVLSLLDAGMRASEVARQVGIGYTTVREIRDSQLAGKVDRHGFVQFRRAKKTYYCNSCKAWVMVIPCPACEARKTGRR